MAGRLSRPSWATQWMSRWIGAASVYIADASSDRIRKVDAGGRISTIAGSAIRGFSGDGGPATRAQLASPNAVAVDRDGNVYIGDWGSHRVRKVDQNGTITTFAGTGPSYPGDGGPATQAALLHPYFAHVGKDGRLYIADSGDNRIRRVDQDGNITTIGGTGAAGFAGDGCPAVDAQLNEPLGLALDPVGNVYIADRFNNRIRRVDRTGVITTVAGNGAKGFSGDGGPAREAQLSNVWGIAVDDAGNLYIADTDNNRIRKVDPSGRITAIAGVGSAGSSGDGEPATGAQLNTPVGVSVGVNGELYIAELNGGRIRKIDAAGIITTVAGPASGS
jgi:sugar lactone lactonase YvrE